jgi:hypothetical protein
MRGFRGWTPRQKKCRRQAMTAAFLFVRRAQRHCFLMRAENLVLGSYDFYS